MSGSIVDWCRGHEELHDLGNDKDWPVPFWTKIIFREDDMGTSMAAVFALIMETCIGVGSEDHATCSI